MTGVSESIKKARAKIKEWRWNLPRFVFEQFGVTPDKWQEKALLAFGRADAPRLRIALQACAGPGKSALLAWCGWNFLSCWGRKGEHPKGAAVSVTLDNLRANLWPEFAKWRNRSEWLKSAFEWTGERIFAKDHPETWFLEARSWAKKANPEEQGRTLSGLHSEFPIILIDESGDIPLSVLRAGEQALSKCIRGRILQAGNPTSTTGMLYAAATEFKHLWESFRITGDPDDPDRSPRIDIEWARQQIATYGRENPWVMAYILGLFPPGGINNLLGPDEVADAMKRHLSEDAYDWSQKRLGVDAARFGTDPWVIFPRQGLASFMPIVMMHPKTEDIVGRIMAKKLEWGSEIEFVDGTGGYGAGCVDGLRQARARNVIEVQYSGKPLDPRFFNKRSEMMWLCAQWVKKGGALPPVTQLAKEMTTPIYWHEAGKLRVEEKEQIKKRLGFSPNHFDALSNTFALPDAPRETGDLAARLAQVNATHAKMHPQGSMAGWHPWNDLEGSASAGDDDRKIPL